LDEIADDGQGADVFVEKGFGDFLLVVVGETGGAELVAWLRRRTKVRNVSWTSGYWDA
jgi:hypothetical protein